MHSPLPCQPDGTLELSFIGYTYCPDVCPTTLADLRSVYPALKKIAPTSQVVFIRRSSRDDSARLKSYTASFRAPESARRRQHLTVPSFPSGPQSGAGLFHREGDARDYLGSTTRLHRADQPEGKLVATFRPKVAPVAPLLMRGHAGHGGRLRAYRAAGWRVRARTMLIPAWLMDPPPPPQGRLRPGPAWCSPTSPIPLLGLVDTWVIGHLARPTFGGVSVQATFLINLCCSGCLASCACPPQAGPPPGLRVQPMPKGSLTPWRGPLGLAIGLGMALLLLLLLFLPGHHCPRWRLFRRGQTHAGQYGVLGAGLSAPAALCNLVSHGVVAPAAGCTQSHAAADPGQSLSTWCWMPGSAGIGLAGERGGPHLPLLADYSSFQGGFSGEPASALTSDPGVAQRLQRGVPVAGPAAAARPEPGYFLYPCALCLQLCFVFMTLQGPGWGCGGGRQCGVLLNFLMLDFLRAADGFCLCGGSLW